MAVLCFNDVLKLCEPAAGSNQWMNERAGGETLELLRAGRREEAFEQLLTNHQSRVYRLALAMLRNPHAAEDATQETFLRIWKALPQFRGESDIATWIHSIARNRCLSYLERSSTRRENTVEEMPEQASPPPDPEPYPVLMYALQHLDGRQREAVALFYLEDRSYEEMSTLMGIPIGSVKTYLHRARNALAEKFQTRGKARQS